MHCADNTYKHCDGNAYTISAYNYYVIAGQLSVPLL